MSEPTKLFDCESLREALGDAKYRAYAAARRASRIEVDSSESSVRRDEEEAHAHMWANVTLALAARLP